MLSQHEFRTNDLDRIPLRRLADGGEVEVVAELKQVRAQLHHRREVVHRHRRQSNPRVRRGSPKPLWLVAPRATPPSPCSSPGRSP